MAHLTRLAGPKIFALPVQSDIARWATLMSIASIGGTSIQEKNRSAVAGLERAADPFSKYLQNAAEAAAPTSVTDQPVTSFDKLALLKSQLESSDSPEINLGDLQREAANGLSEFRRTVAQLCDDAGIDRTREIRLESDGHGGIVVAGDHPDADKIEDLFKSNPDLVSKFQTLAAAHKKLQAAQNDPIDTTAMFTPQFGISLLGDEIKASFK